MAWAPSDRAKPYFNSIAANRPAFVDTYQILAGYDYKNSLRPASRVVVSNAAVVDNRYLNRHLRFGWPKIAREELDRGGFFSADGMHPSGVGYAILASEAMKALNIQHNRAALLKSAYDDDRLLSDYPAELDMVANLLSIIREAMSIGQFAHGPIGDLTDQVHFADLLRAIKKIFIR